MMSEYTRQTMDFDRAVWIIDFSFFGWIVCFNQIINFQNIYHGKPKFKM